MRQGPFGFRRPLGMTPFSQGSGKSPEAVVSELSSFRETANSVGSVQTLEAELEELVDLTVVGLQEDFSKEDLDTIAGSAMSAHSMLTGTAQNKGLINCSTAIGLNESFSFIVFDLLTGQEIKESKNGYELRLAGLS